MADPKHVEVVLEGSEALKEWRDENREVTLAWIFA